jgi:uncharacterized protein
LPNAQILMKPFDGAIADFLANRPMAIDAFLPEGIKLLLHSLETPANLPFSRELWMHSLAEDIAKINDPMLIVIGKKDIQVDWKVDGKLLENANAQKTAVLFVYPENANHLLKHEETPCEELNAKSVALNYNAPNSELDKEAANAIFDWLKTTKLSIIIHLEKGAKCEEWALNMGETMRGRLN